MEEKEPIKVKLSTVLLIIAVIVVIAVAIIIGITFKQNTENNVTNNNATNSATLEHTTQKDIGTEQLAVNEQKDVDKIILDELKEKQFLAKNNIDIYSKVKYAKMDSNGKPIYIVHVEHDQDEIGNKSIYFFVSYSNGQVLFNKALEHKYEYDLYYEPNTNSIKAELEYKGYITTIYGKIKEDGDFEQLDEFIESTNEEIQKYILNDNEVSSKEFENGKKQYEDKKYISFLDIAKKLEDEMELMQFEEKFSDLEDVALDYRECEKIKNYKDFEYDLDGDSKKDKITIKNIGKDDLRKRRRYS